MRQDDGSNFMIELVNWLIHLEQMAGDTYGELAAALEADRTLHDFLAEMADQERQHADMMRKIRQLAWDMGAEPTTDIRLDAHTRQRIEAPLRQLKQALTAGTISGLKAVNAIVEVEFSEWNDIFLYVVKKFRDVSRETQQMAATIQEHEGGVREFIDRLPSDLKPDKPFAALERVWDANLLVAEDSLILRDAVAGILEALGRVILAADGKEALEAVKLNHFDAVISDIQMPGMSGLEFYQKASALYPDLEYRFVFMSFSPSRSEQRYIDENNLSFLQKPFSPDELKHAVTTILSRGSRAS